MKFLETLCLIGHLISHKRWLNDDERGVKLNFFNINISLSYADLRFADLSYANLRFANLRSANLSSADLRFANLRSADLCFANLRSANLSSADLRSANLSPADLSSANLRYADLRSADLSSADLRFANLRYADLSSADLSSADLRFANLSMAKNINHQTEWIDENFEKDDKGVIVYKAIGNTTYSKPDEWEIKEGSFLTEVCNPCRVSDCACGVNFGTEKWVGNNYGGSDIWKCRINWIDLVGVVVPYQTDGKARCERLELIEKV